MKDYDEVRGLRHNSDKLRYDLIPPLANREYAKVWTQALGKYPEGNWEKGMPWTEVIASAMRHLEAIRLGEDIDAESGLLHAAHLQCNAAMLTEYYLLNKILITVKNTKQNDFSTEIKSKKVNSILRKIN
jgi:hypothetical protein